MRSFRTIPTLKLINEILEREDDHVAIETALEVHLNKEFIAAFIYSPGLEKELTIGYLLSSGIITSIGDIEKIRYSANRCFITTRKDAMVDLQRGTSRIRRLIGTECSAPDILRELRGAHGIPTIRGSVEVSLEDLYDIASVLRESQTGHHKTGALHGALVMDIHSHDYAFAEDLGRHNAADKAIGQASLRGLDLTDCMLFCSGRLTADIVSKCAWSSIPILLSYAVSTDAGVKFAQKAKLTLIGSFRGKKMRIYNQGAGRIRELITNGNHDSGN